MAPKQRKEPKLATDAPMQPEPDNAETPVTAALRAALATASEGARVAARRANSERALRRAHTPLEEELYAALQQLLL